MTTILVIEDNGDILEGIVEQLNLEGFNTVGAANGRIGLEMVPALKPDLILCDVMMPELDGFGVLAALRSDASTADIPFIFLTARANKADIEKGTLLGANQYVTKPFTQSSLVDAVKLAIKPNPTSGS